MVAVQVESKRLERRVMSWEDYLRLPEKHVEYVDGVAIVSLPANSGHNKAQVRLAVMIETGLDARLDVVTESGWRRVSRVRVPDIAVYETKEQVDLYDQTPLLVVEVLSPSTRAEDTLRKSHEYAVAGVGQYWILDGHHRTLTVLRHRGDGWELVDELDDGAPRGEISVGDLGVVAVDLEALLAL